MTKSDHYEAACRLLEKAEAIVTRYGDANQTARAVAYTKMAEAHLKAIPMAETEILR